MDLLYLGLVGFAFIDVSIYLFQIFLFSTPGFISSSGGRFTKIAKRKDSSRMEAQVIRYENAKDKKL